MGPVIIEIVKALCAIGVTAFTAWLKRRQDLKDLKTGKKNLYRDF